MKIGSGADILVTNIEANPPPPCAVHSFCEWQPAEVWVTNENCGKQIGVERICKDCGRYEWTEGVRA